MYFSVSFVCLQVYLSGKCVFKRNLELTGGLTIWPALSQGWENPPGGDQQTSEQMTSLHQRKVVVEITVMVMAMTMVIVKATVRAMAMAMIVMVTEREFSRYLVDGGIHLR